MKRFLAAMTRHPVSLAGVALTTVAAVLFVILFAVEFIGFEGGPYLGIVTFMILPGMFLLGLVLIPVGLWLRRRRLRKGGDDAAESSPFPVLDFNSTKVQRAALLFVVASLVNVTILALATYKGVEFMDSTSFCGETCHSVMDPEFTVYQRSPHSRVRCVDCHIGPGAGFFVKSKLSGAWQVVSTTFDLYPRPIPTPVHNLRPARDTCEQCHWPTKFVGDRLEVLTRYTDDEANTETKTVLLLHVGGMSGTGSEGIHWHVDPNIRIRYRSDPSRSEITAVELSRRNDGDSVTYYADGADHGAAQGEAEQEWRVMDCVDCHNRPTHIYSMPGPEVNAALELGRIDSSLPYIRREAQGILEQSYASHQEAREQIPGEVRAFYAETYPDVLQSRSEQIEAAGETLADIWVTHVFPKMSIEWGTYPNHIGHEQFPGCFRCHNDELATAEGDVISQDCDTCHALLAWEEEEPEILEQLRP